MTLRTTCAFALTFAALWTACGSESGTSRPSAGRGGSNTDGSAGDGGEAANGATGAISTTGGNSGSGTGGTGGTSTGGSAGDGGSAPIDASYPDMVFTYDGAGGTGPVTEDSACASVSQTAQVERQPADIIFVVDNSGSMSTEAGQVQANLNSFSQQISASGIDVHVVLISSYPGTGQGICIAPPLGSGGCPTQDTKPPTFLHVNQEVGSTNALSLLLSEYSRWQGAMRATAPKHVVIVTDDNSSLNETSFDTQFRALHSSHVGYKFHAIYGYTKPGFFTCLGGGDPCCGQTANVGTVYQKLVQLTGGVQGNLCLQDFTPVFNVLANTVISGTPIKCEFPMPVPQQGVVNPDQVTLEFSLTAAAPRETWTRVAGAGSCTATGFYYDQMPNPTRIILCPQACATAQQASNPTLRVLLGCLGS